MQGQTLALVFSALLMSSPQGAYAGDNLSPKQPSKSKPPAYAPRLRPHRADIHSAARERVMPDIFQSITSSLKISMMPGRNGQVGEGRIVSPTSSSKWMTRYKAFIPYFLLLHHPDPGGSIIASPATPLFVKEITRFLSASTHSSATLTSDVAELYHEIAGAPFVLTYEESSSSSAYLHQSNFKSLCKHPHNLRPILLRLRNTVTLSLILIHFLSTLSLELRRTSRVMYLVHLDCTIIALEVAQKSLLYVPLQQHAQTVIAAAITTVQATRELAEGGTASVKDLGRLILAKYHQRHGNDIPDEHDSFYTSATRTAISKESQTAAHIIIAAARYVDLEKHTILAQGPTSLSKVKDLSNSASFPFPTLRIVWKKTSAPSTEDFVPDTLWGDTLLLAQRLRSLCPSLPTPSGMDPFLGATPGVEEARLILGELRARIPILPLRIMEKEGSTWSSIHSAYFGGFTISSLPIVAEYMDGLLRQPALLAARCGAIDRITLFLFDYLHLYSSSTQPIGLIPTSVFSTVAEPRRVKICASIRRWGVAIFSRMIGSIFLNALPRPGPPYFLVHQGSEAITLIIRMAKDAYTADTNRWPESALQLILFAEDATDMSLLVSLNEVLAHTDLSILKRVSKWMEQAAHNTLLGPVPPKNGEGQDVMIWWMTKAIATTNAFMTDVRQTHRASWQASQGLSKRETSYS